MNMQGDGNARHGAPRRTCGRCGQAKVLSVFAGDSPVCRDCERKDPHEVRLRTPWACQPLVIEALKGRYCVSCELFLDEAAFPGRRAVCGACAEKAAAKGVRARSLAECG